MEEQKFSRRIIVFYLQLTAAVVSLLIGIFNLTKESAPLVRKMQESHQQAVEIRRQEDLVKKANEIAGMSIPWKYRGNDGAWRYYSDEEGRYWCRVNIQGVQEYSERPDHVASSNMMVRR